MSEVSPTLKKYGPQAIVLYHVFSFMDAYDTQSISVCMRPFEISLGLSPSSLSIVAGVDFMAALGLSPLWGYLVDNRGCHLVESTAMVLIGITCILLGCTSSYPMILLLRLIHGAALGCTGPVIQKIITESREKNSHGTWFGIYHAVYCSGRLVSAIVTARLAMSTLLGQYGWRLSYCAMGYAWLITAVPVFTYMRHEGNSSQSGNQAPGSNGTLMNYMSDTFKTTTSRILVFVIFTSDAPYAVMVYMVMYLQYSGLSDIMAGIACAVGLMGGVVGGVAGGFAIDGCHKLNDKYGRLVMGVGLLILRLLSASLLLMRPLLHARMEWYHYVEVSLIGATLVTPQSIDRPILSAIVKDNVQAVALSLNRVVAGIPSSLTFVPLIGFMAEKLFGYVNRQGTGDNQEMRAMLTNATALRKSMLYVAVVATMINILLYLAMLLTYPRDANSSSAQPKK